MASDYNYDRRTVSGSSSYVETELPREARGRGRGLQMTPQDKKILNSKKKAEKLIQEARKMISGSGVLEQFEAVLVKAYRANVSVAKKGDGAIAAATLKGLYEALGGNEISQFRTKLQEAMNALEAVDKVLPVSLR